MNIEKDLQQKKPFASHTQRAIVNLFFTSKFVETKLQSLHKKHGITMKQYNILRILKGAKEPISTQLIRQRMIDRMSDISRIVDRMIDKDLVSKCANCDDKRLVDISLTKKGSKLLKEIDPLEMNKKKILGSLNEKEAQELNKLLDKIRGYN